LSYKIKHKYYSNKDKLFHIIKEDDRFLLSKQDLTFETFDEFYKATKKNLTNANLVYYDFDNEKDIKKYDLSKAMISSKTMIKLGNYNDELYKSIKDSEHLNFTFSSSRDLVVKRNAIKEYDNPVNNDLIICYLSDLHINHKLNKKFKQYANKYEIAQYFKETIIDLLKSIPKFEYKRNILFIGDISYNFEMFRLFFKIYDNLTSKFSDYFKTFFIMGNHELWDSSLINECNSIEQIIEQYRNYLSSLDKPIILLENQIYFPNENKILNKEEILSISNEDFRKHFTKNGYAIFGSLGYAGLNNEFNYNNGIYRNAPITRKEEIERSQIVDNLHKRLTEIASDKNIFFITHMPYKDWSTGELNKNWTYLYGHNHKNFYSQDEYKIYADNQIGYNKMSFGFKYITTTTTYDIFADYKDGIYNITKDQYIKFNRGINNYLDFNRKFKKLYMIKKDDLYLFLIQLEKNGKLYILNGGAIKSVGSHEPEYFYDNMTNYANSIKMYLNDYSKYQKNISNEIKKIGGTGTIHGCIIDIDFYNHIYVNPFDRKITPYFAYAIDNKYVYNNLRSLLKYNCKTLYNKYLSLSNKDNQKNAIILRNNNEIESDKKVFVEDTEIYRVSRIIKSFQYLTNKNVIRIWSDNLLESNIENGKMLVYNSIYPQKAIEKPKQKVVKIKVVKEPKTIDRFAIYKSKLENKTTNIRLLSYTGAKQNAEYECLSCGHKWKQRPDHFKDSNYKCPKCKK